MKLIINPGFYYEIKYSRDLFFMYLYKVTASIIFDMLGECPVLANI